MSEEVKRPDLLIHALKGAIPGVVVPITKIEEATRLVEYIESLESKLRIAEEALKFYADEDNWGPYGPLNQVRLWKESGTVTLDNESGRKAREALEAACKK